MCFIFLAIYTQRLISFYNNTICQGRSMIEPQTTLISLEKSCPKTCNTSLKSWTIIKYLLATSSCWSVPSIWSQSCLSCPSPYQPERNSRQRNTKPPGGTKGMEGGSTWSYCSNKFQQQHCHPGHPYHIGRVALVPTKPCLALHGFSLARPGTWLSIDGQGTSMFSMKLHVSKALWVRSIRIWREVKLLSSPPLHFSVVCSFEQGQQGCYMSVANQALYSWEREWQITVVYLRWCHFQDILHTH